MNKTELIAAVAEKASISKKDADSAVNAVIDTIVEALAAEEKVQIVGFGTFEIRSRSARQAAIPERTRPSRSRLPRSPLSRPARRSRIPFQVRTEYAASARIITRAACLESATEGCGQDAHTARTGRAFF